MTDLNGSLNDRRRTAIGSALALTVLAGCTAGPDQAGSRASPETISPSGFEAIDDNANGTVDAAELVSDSVAGFQLRDRNADGVLEGDELRGLDPALIARVDRSGDGRLSLTETIRARMVDFGAGDLDADGRLTRQEATAMGRWP